MTNLARLRILFAGTPDFSVPPLQRLIAEGLPPVAVLTQPDRPAGRGRQLQASPVKQAATTAGIPVHQPVTLKDASARDLVSKLRPDLMIVVAYGLILPQEILQLPRFGCWNIHASLLPRWRGAAPIQRAIEAGDHETGVCIMQMNEGLDTGPVIHRASTEMGEYETGGSLHDRLAELGTSVLLDCVHRLNLGEPLKAEPHHRYEELSQQLDSAISDGNKAAEFYLWIHGNNGRAFLQTIRLALKRPSQQDVVVSLFNAIGFHFAELGLTRRFRTIEDLQSFNAGICNGDCEKTCQQLSTEIEWILRHVPESEGRIHALLGLAQLSEVLLDPIFGGSDCLGSVLRNRIKPVSEPLLEMVSRLEE